MIQKIKSEIENLLKDFVFDDNKPRVGQVEDKLANVLDKFLNETDLVDYWIDANLDDDTFDVRIGLQEGEFENTRITYIDCVVI